MDVKSQRIVNQLNNLYDRYSPETDPLSRHHSHTLYNLIFDHLERENIKIDYAPEIKKKLWKLAKIELNEQRKGWIKMYNRQKDPDIKAFFKKQLDDELMKFYKTYLVRKYLYDLLREEGKTLKLIDAESGKEIKRLELSV
jgi:hypothetical protein